jgi:large subunit ribosomal protein L17
MRHGKKFNHLSRTSAHRKAMLANMACSLIEHKRIKTTLAKAKALRVYVEPLVTKSKNDTTHSRRTVFSYLKQKEAVTELFGDIATKVLDREGGYTRILKLSNRLGDNAQMAFIELVDYNDDYITDKPKRRKARRAKKKIVESVTPIAEETIVDEVPAIEEAIVEETVKDEVPAIEEAIVEETVKDEVPAIEEAIVEETVKDEVSSDDEDSKLQEEEKRKEDDSPKGEQHKS